MNLELVILKNLIYNEEYLRKVLPFLKSEYFSNKTEKVIFNEVIDFTQKYNNSPTVESLKIAVGELNITQDEVDNIQSYIREIEANKSDATKLEWIIDKTEEFCQEKSIYNAVLGSISILDGADKTNDKGAIPKILSDALSVSFDNSVGHDYLEDASARYEYYHRKESKIPFDLDYFNKITKGGLSTKTLNVILAGTGVGKSLFMCHVAASCMAQGKNVLYITMEMAEERIAERIDANLLNVSMDELMELSEDSYVKKVNRVRSKTIGKLLIKEYPTASASATHFRTLLNELNLKRNFVPDIIFVDYLNICCSSRLKVGSNVNSYTYVKAIAEELRGLAVEYDLPLVTATQTTRSGFNSSDPGMEDVSESFGLPATADMMFALVSSEELEQLNQIMVKQLKNRYSDLTHHKRFTIGIDRAKMKLYDIEQSAQADIVDAGHGHEFSPAKQKKNFEGFKV
jgi:replicative DNA helicase